MTFPATDGRRQLDGSDAMVIGTERLLLTPLAGQNAGEMFSVLDDARLHAFTGGAPASAAELRARYERLAAGSPDPEVCWLNWIVRRRPDGLPIGTVQATLARAARTAEVAWVIGAGWQSRGYATEAARGLVAWLLGQGATAITACIHPGHHASARVAARAGLSPTDGMVDSERVWRLTAAAPTRRSGRAGAAACRPEATLWP